MKDIQIITKDIPLDQIDFDPKQPRREFGVDENDKKNRLMLSMKEIGLKVPLAVRKNGANKYIIITGQRRFMCAKLLEWKSIRCDIHPETDAGEIKRVRFDIENNHRLWNPSERSREITDIKALMDLKTAKECSDVLHITEKSVIQSIALRKKRDQYQGLMDEYKLPESYQEEFIRLEPKIRPIKEFTHDKIIRNLFSRVKHQVIRSARDFYRLGPIFLHAHANEKELHIYLSDPDMKVGELMEKVKKDKLVRDIEGVMRQTSKRLSEGFAFPQDVKKAMMKFHAMLGKSL